MERNSRVRHDQDCQCGDQAWAIQGEENSRVKGDLLGGEKYLFS